MKSIGDLNIDLSGFSGLYLQHQPQTDTLVEEWPGNLLDMSFLAQEHQPISNKDILSRIFDEQVFDQDQTVRPANYS